MRARRMPRLLHLAGHRGLPLFFDIDDTVPAAAVLPIDPAGLATAADPEEDA